VVKRLVYFCALWRLLDPRPNSTFSLSGHYQTSVAALFSILLLGYAGVLPVNYRFVTAASSLISETLDELQQWGLPKL
jgi:hypothetical protein